MTRIYKTPFATTSDALEPLATNEQPDGKVSLPTGWTSVYELPSDNPSYKPVGRGEMNGALNEITAAIGELQLQGGVVRWQAIDGGFNKGAITYGADMQTLWQSTEDANTTDPDSGGSSGWSKMIPDDDAIIIYPNGGSAGSPANITNSQRYVVNNPFSGSYVNCRLQAYISGAWGDVMNNIGYAIIGGNSYSVGCAYGQLGDNIIIQTAVHYVMATSASQGNIFGTQDTKTTIPVRIIVEKVRGSL